MTEKGKFFKSKKGKLSFHNHHDYIFLYFFCISFTRRKKHKQLLVYSIQ